MMRPLILAMALCAAPVAATAQQVEIETTGKGELITVTASADMAVDARTAWAVISDYDHLAEFIPDMRSSRVVQREGAQVMVEQTGKFGFLFFQQPVDVKLAVTETPPTQIVARAVGGNLREMEGRYALENLASGEVRLTYAGRMIPDFPIPPVVGKVALRSALSRQFAALVREIVRRDGQLRAAQPAR